MIAAPFGTSSTITSYDGIFFLSYDVEMIAAPFGTSSTNV
jgi:hypothetical protein